MKGKLNVSNNDLMTSHSEIHSVTNSFRDMGRKSVGGRAQGGTKLSGDDDDINSMNIRMNHSEKKNNSISLGMSGNDKIGV